MKNSPSPFKKILTIIHLGSWKISWSYSYLKIPLHYSLWSELASVIGRLSKFVCINGHWFRNLVHVGHCAAGAHKCRVASVCFDLEMAIGLFFLPLSHNRLKFVIEIRILWRRIFLLKTFPSQFAKNICFVCTWLIFFGEEKSKIHWKMFLKWTENLLFFNLSVLL